MTYLIYDESMKLIDVLEFTEKELEAYKQSNPLNIVEKSEDLHENYLLQDEEILDLEEVFPDE